MLQHPPLHGATVTLRPTTAADGAAVYAAFGDPEVDRLTGTQGSFTLEQVEAHYARIVDADDRVDYAIVPASGPERLLGEAVLNGIDRENRSASFRIVLFDSADFGRGYGGQATRLLVAYGFEQLGLHRIELEVYDFNPRAEHVYRKAGFRREGMRRDVLLWDGIYHSAIVMSLLRPEYEAMVARAEATSD
jgi:RimJ/RimL family protein N-acetyltransferase